MRPMKEATTQDKMQRILCELVACPNQAVILKIACLTAFRFSTILNPRIARNAFFLPAYSVLIRRLHFNFESS